MTIRLNSINFIFIPMSIFIKIERPQLSDIKTISIGIFSSILVELIQLLINIITRYPCHVCDVDDLILNFAGIIVGYLIYLLIVKVDIFKNLFKKLVYKN